jgi:hypothetical protein
MNLDDRVDLVARTMTDAHPSPDFRARVLAALPQHRPRPWPRFAMPVAAAILIGTIAWLAGSSAHRNFGPSVTSAPAVTTAALDPALVPVVPVVPVVPAFAQATAGKPVEDPAWRARAIPRLETADALALGRIQPIALSIAPITMEPITPPDPIALAPIESRAGGR